MGENLRAHMLPHGWVQPLIMLQSQKIAKELLDKRGIKTTPLAQTFTFCLIYRRGLRQVQWYVKRLSS